MLQNSELIIVYIFFNAFCVPGPVLDDDTVNKRTFSAHILEAGGEQ